MDIPGSLATWAAAFVAASAAMVAGMVLFTMSLVRPNPSSNARTFWGLAYALSWVAIVYLILRMPEADVNPGADLRWISVFAASGWGTFNALWIMFWSAIVHANARDGMAVGMPGDVDLLARRASRVAMLGGAIVAVALWNMGAPQRLIANVLAPGHRAASATIALGAGGFILFMTGAIRLALYGGGEMTFTPEELGRAWRSGEWRRENRWITAFLMFCGAILALLGGLSTGFVLGDDTTRVVLTLFIAFGLFQAWRGSRRRSV